MPITRPSASGSPTQAQRQNASIARFRQWAVGLFVHYGLFTLLGRHEWAMHYERIPVDEYRRLLDRFTAQDLDPAQWIALAQQFGARYACFTARHHEGFALFDTATTSFSSPNSPAGRDLVLEYTQACRAAGIGVGIYYSVADWTDPVFSSGPRNDPGAWQQYVEVVHTQLRELMSNYGPIDYLFYDGCPLPDTWGAAEINAEIRQLQPGIVINNRCGLDEDLISSEQKTINDPGKPWEMCMTLNESWGYNPGDANWKTPRQLIANVATCAHNGGNILINVGPRSDGSIEDQAAALLTDLGEWLRVNGEAIYKISPHPFDYHDVKLSTARGDEVFVTLHHYHGPDTTIAGIANQVRSVRLLATGREVDFVQRDNRVTVTGLPEHCPDPFYAVLALKLDGPPRGIPHRYAGTTRYT